ncbi:peptidoglycan-binding domain-containing protein [Litorivita sp. NS0012-18]|uniref:peptidoglycan-binding domain-containing protein n=1 Tax=Litorivita sp. NS0012-18 TaxID=3127655 RepID=UPI003104FBB4
MYSRHLICAALAASMITAPVSRATAGNGDFIAGAIIGGIVGAAANSQAKKSQPKKTYRKAAPRLPSTQEGREIQASLNYFGFNAGRVDGQLGGQSRRAVTQYQAYMGYPMTGHLTPFEQQLLTNSYNRAMAGGSSVMQMVAANPDGTRGLLKTWRSEMAGGTMAAAPGQVVTAAPGMTTVVVNQQPAAPAAPEPAAPAAPTVMAAAEAPALPNFMGEASARSLASHCNKVSLLTNSNGGFVKVGAITDPNVALSEQFCLARTYAISRGEELTAKVQGATPAQIEAQCKAFGPIMKPHVAALSLKSQAEVVQGVSGYILTTGMAPEHLAGTATICLSSGYRTDDMDVAVGSALLLYALGETVYGELMGHHLSQGFGASTRSDLAEVWYASALDALDAGSPAVFAPGQPERNTLIRAAVFGGGDASALPAPTAASLPTFKVAD